MRGSKRGIREKPKVRVFIVDDHPVMRQGIGDLIQREADLAVCGGAESAAEALTAIEAQEPDLAIVDLSLKNSSGMELIKDLQIRCPKVLILVLSMHDETFYAERVLRAGAKGYIAKDEVAERVIDGIRRILRGEVYLSEKMSSKMISKMVGGRPRDERPTVECLTDREIVVFELIGIGLGTREIAEKLHLSVKTIESHREHIKEKLKLDSATALLKYAIQWLQFERKA